jgi:hypothetical protein
MATVNRAPSRKRSGCVLAAYGSSTTSARMAYPTPMAATQDRALTVRWGLKGLR